MRDELHFLSNMYDQEDFGDIASNETQSPYDEVLEPTTIELSDAQEVAMSILQVASATLSLIGSSTIVYKILRNHTKTQKTPPYDRIILGLSGCDIVASIAFALGPFLLPTTTDRVWALGNDMTCTGLGFLTQLSFGWAIWYNVILSFYYLLTVRFNVKREEFCKKYELWMHLSGVLFFPTTSLVGFFGDWYSAMPRSMNCWIGDIPKGCEADGTCSNLGTTIQYIFVGAPMLIGLLALILNNIIIYVYVRKTLLFSRKTAAPKTTFEIENFANETPQPTPDTENFVTPDTENFATPDTENFANETSQALAEENSNTREKRLTREVAIQGFLYVSSFLVAFTPSFVLQLLYSIGYVGDEYQVKLFPLSVVNSMLLPLQGFFNVFIYVRPTFNRFRAANPERPTWFVMRHALFDPNIPKLATSHVREATDNT